eukprot:8092010-Karenia_brevis.AAC.1
MQLWHFPEWCRSLQPTFGKFKGLFRVEMALCEILELQKQGRQAEAHATTVQLTKCILQVALDQGDWSNGSLMLPWGDP